MRSLPVGIFLIASCLLVYKSCSNLDVDVGVAFLIKRHVRALNIPM